MNLSIKRLLPLIITTAVVGGVGLFIINDQSSALPEAELRTEIGCNRITDDYRPTDEYCNDYNKYLRHLNSDGLLSEGDMRKEFECDRVTTEFRNTDIYCNDYVKYVHYNATKDCLSPESEQC